MCTLQPRCCLEDDEIDRGACAKYSEVTVRNVAALAHATLEEAANLVDAIVAQRVGVGLQARGEPRYCQNSGTL